MKYHISSRILHALMAVLIITLFCVGIFMADFMPQEATYKFQVYALHKSFGVMVLILVFVRIVNRFIHTPPAMPQGLPKIEKFAAHAIHYLLYVLMFLVPLSGYLMSNAYGFPVDFFNIRMPNLISAQPENGRFFAESHEILAFTLIGAVGLHLAGALKHRFFDKPENDVLNRMF